MIWIAIAALLAAIIFLVVRNRPAAVALSRADQLKEQAKTLPISEQERLAVEVREQAFAGYDRASAKAREEGRSEAFAHEVGVMDAVYCVLANDDAARRNEALRPLLQMEGVPFNRLTSDSGRAAVAEYLVWKFFPGRADLATLDRAMAQFTRTVFDAAERELETDETIYRMIYSHKYDWQRLAIPHAHMASGEENG